MSQSPFMSEQPDGFIRWACTHCKKTLKMPEDAAGKEVTCPECGTAQTAPKVDLPPVVADASPEVTFLEDQQDRSPPAARPASSDDNDATNRDAIGTLSIKRSMATEAEETPTRRLFRRVIDEISKIFVGQDELVLGSLLACFPVVTY